MLNGKAFRKQKDKFKATSDDFYLRDHLSCPICKNHVIGSASKGRNGRHYYYHCNHCGNYRIKNKRAHLLVEELLEEFQFSAPARKVHDMMVKTILSKTFAQRKRSKETIEKEIDQVNMKLANIDDKWALNEMNTDEHRRLKSKFSFQLGQLTNEKDAYCNENTELSRYLKSGIKLMADLKRFYQKANINTRKKLLGSIFPETL